MVRSMPGQDVRIYECRVQAVRSHDRVIDATSIRGRKFRSLTYLLPYINAQGSGFDLVPQVGDRCLVLASPRPGGLEVAIGFKVSLADGGQGLELGGRLDPLPPGSQAMRVVGEDGSEARVICYRGGTLVLGSGALAATVYTPLGAIRHLFDNWHLEGPGGACSWTREPGTDKVTYAAEYRTRVSPKTPGLRVAVNISPQGLVPVSVSVTRSDSDDHPALEIQVDDQGVAHLRANILEVDALATVRVNAPNIVFNDRRLLPGKQPI